MLQSVHGPVSQTSPGLLQAHENFASIHLHTFLQVLNFKPSTYLLLQQHFSPEAVTTKAAADAALFIPMVSNNLMCPLLHLLMVGSSGTADMLASATALTALHKMSLDVAQASISLRPSPLPPTYNAASFS